MQAVTDSVLFARLLAIPISLGFVFVASVFLLIFVNAVRTGRVHQKRVAEVTYRAKNPVQFWLTIAPFPIFACLAIYAVARLAIEAIGWIRH